MEDENAYGQGLSYDEEVPYEAQVDPNEGSSASGPLDLKNRIGKRIYLLEDALANKHKHSQVGGDRGEDEDERITADLPYRPNALLLQGPAITQLPTARVFAYAVHFDAHPIGLEWVDDQTCVLVFNSNKAAKHAWNALRRPVVGAKPEEAGGMEMDEPELMFVPAHSLPLALFPIEERISTVLGSKKSEDLRQPIQMRWALPTDVKARDAKSKSQFYKRFGESAGKPGIPGSSMSSGRDESYDVHLRRRQDDEEERRRQLDAELDSFLQEDDTGGVSFGSRAGERSTRGRLTDEEKRRMLDEELDAFLAAGDSGDLDPSLEVDVDEQPRTSLLQRTRPRSSRSRSPIRRKGDGTLLERTRRRSRSPRRDRTTGRLPRTGRRERTETRYQTDEDGRWLHNAEVVERKRRVESFNPGVFGMRAWADDVPQRPPKKARKTAEDLDRELDEFNRHAT